VCSRIIVRKGGTTQARSSAFYMGWRKGRHFNLPRPLTSSNDLSACDAGLNWKSWEATGAAPSPPPADLHWVRRRRGQQAGAGCAPGGGWRGGNHRRPAAGLKAVGSWLAGVLWEGYNVGGRSRVAAERALSFFLVGGIEMIGEGREGIRKTWQQQLCSTLFLFHPG